jgi:hypothetical protein
MSQLKNRETFHTDPGEFQLANQGVAKISFPPSKEGLQTLQAELGMFVCDGAYAEGLARILEAFLGALPTASNAPAVWISGFYGSGKSHLASMLAALWTNLTFPDGSTAQGLVPHLPDQVLAPLRELRAAVKRCGGVIAAGDTLGTGPSDPAEATLSILLRAVGLPTDIRAAQVALWLADEGILDEVRTSLGENFDKHIRSFILSRDFHTAVLSANPSLGNDEKDISAKLRDQFPTPPPVTVDFLEDMGRRVLMLGRKEIPLTLLVLDEVQQFIRQEPGLTLKIQTIAERLSSRFDGRLLLVATGQQALSDVSNLQKLLDRFPVRIALGEADVDAVIRKTVLRKKPGAEADIKTMLEKNSGEIHRHLQGSKLAHSTADERDAILDWPLLPSRRRVWEVILRELDRTGLGGTLRGQLRTTLDAARSFADKPLGHAVPADFLYGRFATDAFNLGILPNETRNRIETLQGGTGSDPLKARILMLIYMLGRISGDAEQHGVRATPEILADLLTADLAGEADLRRRVPLLLQELNTDGSVIEIGGEWKLQTKESADWETTYRAEEKVVLADQTTLSRLRREILDKIVDIKLSGTSKILHGVSKVSRTVHRLKPGDKEPAEGVPLRLHNGWDEDLSLVKKEISESSPTDATIHLLIQRHNADALSRALVTSRAAQNVTQLKGVPNEESGREVQRAMKDRAERADREAREILQEAVNQASVFQAGGTVITGQVAEAVEEGARNSLARLYPKFDDSDHTGWGKVFDRAFRKDPDSLKAVDFSGALEEHPVCKALLSQLGPGRKGNELRDTFMFSPYGWSKDTLDGALMALANAGLVRVSGEDGKPVSLPDIPRAKIGLCTFRSETTIVTMQQKLAVQGLLTEVGIRFEKGQEALALSALLDRLEAKAKTSGGEAPAPAPDTVPDFVKLRGLSGNDLLVALAERTSDLRDKVKAWDEADRQISARLKVFHLAKRLVELGATEQNETLQDIKTHRYLLANPDPLPPIISEASAALRTRLNETYSSWEAAWQEAETRLNQDENWQKLSPEQKHQFRQSHGLFSEKKPDVDTPEAIAAALTARGFSEWQSMIKALHSRVDDVLLEAATVFEPKTQTVRLSIGTIKNQADLDAWLEQIRKQIGDALAAGPVVPRV